MSFGFSPSDVVTLITLCNKAYSGWQNGLAEYTDITDTLDSLLVLLQRLDKHFAAHSNDDNQALNARRIRRAAEREDLNRVLGDCDAVVSELYGIVKRYRSLKSNRRAAWKRFRLGTKDLNGLRTKLTRRITSISAFLLTVELDSIDRVEQNVQDLPDIILRSLPLALGNLIDSRISDARSARGSVMTAYTDDDTQIWKQFCRELRRNGVRSRHIKDHGDELHDFFMSVTSSGEIAMGVIDETPEAPPSAPNHVDDEVPAGDDAQSSEASSENGVESEFEAAADESLQSASEEDTPSVVEDLPAEESSSSDDFDSLEEQIDEPSADVNTTSINDNGTNDNINKEKSRVVNTSPSAEGSRRDSLLSKHVPLEQRHARPQNSEDLDLEYLDGATSWKSKEGPMSHHQPSTLIERDSKNRILPVTTARIAPVSQAANQQSSKFIRITETKSRPGDNSDSSFVSDSQSEQSDEEQAGDEDPWRTAWHKDPDDLTVAAIKALNEKYPGGSSSRRPQSEASIEAHAADGVIQKQDLPIFILPEWFTPLSRYDKLYKFQEELNNRYYAKSGIPLSNGVLSMTENGIDIWEIIGPWYLSRYWESLPSSDPGFDGDYNVPRHGSRLHQTGSRGFYWTYRVPLPLAFKGHSALYQRCPEHIIAIWEVEKKRMNRKLTQMAKNHPVVPFRALHSQPTQHVLGEQECCYWYFQQDPPKLLTYSPLSLEGAGNESISSILPAGWRMTFRKDNGRVEFSDCLTQGFKGRPYNISSLPPIVEKWAPRDMPYAWTKRSNENGRIYWEHIVSGLRVAEHPSTHPLIELDPVNGDYIWINWPPNPWRRVEWPNGRILVPLKNISDQFLEAFVADERRIVPTQLRRDVFWRSVIPYQRGAFCRCDALNCICYGEYFSLCRVNRAECEEANPGLVERLREWSLDMASEYDRLVKIKAIHR